VWSTLKQQVAKAEVVHAMLQNNQGFFQLDARPYPPNHPHSNKTEQKPNQETFYHLIRYHKSMPTK